MSRHFHYYEYGNCSVLEILNDNLNIFNKPEILDEFKAVFDGGPIRDIVLDLKNVTHVDSAGIGFLIAAKNISVKLQCDIVMSCANELVLKVLKITRMENFFKIVRSLDEAVDWIRDKATL